MSVIMSLDQGTTSSRTLLVHQSGEVLAQAGAPLRCYHPQSGWVEQDAEEIWVSQRRTIEGALEAGRVNSQDIRGVGITNQRETTVAWERATGKPLAPAIVWQCRRSAEICDRLRDAGHAEILRQKTGLVLDPYFSATKMRWMLENVAGLEGRMREGDVCFGTVDSWLIWKLTNGALHVTDLSNASRTMLCNLDTGDWDDELLALFGISKDALPRIVGSSEVIGETRCDVLPRALPIAGIAGDQQAALFGQNCFDAGQAKNTYGTGCFLMLNTGTQRVNSEHQLLTTVAWRVNDQITYALEGAVFVAGSLLQWMRDKMQFFAEVSETETLALSVDNTDGVYLVPAFVGLGAPHWDAYARGLMIGLTRNTSKAHLVRAGLEAIAYQSAEVLQCMEADWGHPLQELRIDGGASANQFLAQFQADIVGLTVRRPQNRESTAMGAAFLAGLATQVWGSQEELRQAWREERSFAPSFSAAERQQRMEGWLRAEERSKQWES
jgi:glycerol kinase